MLSRLLKQAVSFSLLKGIGHVDVFQDIKILQFANDILLFCSGDEGSPMVAKTILLAFESASDLKINLYKCLIVCLNIHDLKVDTFVNLLNCNKSKLPITFLGLPLHDKKLPKHC